MSAIASSVVRRTCELLRSDSGLPFALRRALDDDDILVAENPPVWIVEQHALPEFLEKTVGARYPAVHVYCQKLANTRRERFMSFSGSILMVADVRVSEALLENVEKSLRCYVDGVLRVLQYNRGDWGYGFCYGGGYTVEFSAIRQGGKNYLQTAKIQFEVDASIR